MTQRDDTAMLVLDADASSSSDEPQSVMQPIGAVTAPEHNRLTLTGLAPIAAETALASGDTSSDPGDSEWLDLSTRWLVATGPQSIQHSTDETEATDILRWADRLSARVGPRAETHSSAPPPPVQPPTAAPGQRRVTMAFGRPSEAVAEASRMGTASGEPPPWHEEPSYSEGRPPHAQRPSWAASSNSATPHPQHMPPTAYATGERRVSQRTEYAPPRRVVPRPSRAPQPRTHEITLEQWKGVADSWIGAVGKLAIAAMALHFSGLAVPLLAHFGYAPAAAESSTRAAAPALASLAAASVIAQPVSPALTGARSDASLQRVEREVDAAVPAAHWRRPAQREASATSETSTRRHVAKPTHKATSQAPHVKASPLAPAADSSTAPPLMAAAPQIEEAAGEATLRINSRPWSQVFVDGTLVGPTPKLDLRVSAGSHRIRLVNAELGLGKTIELHAAAGETVSRVELLED